MVWYSHLFQNFPQFIVIHTVKGFGIVNKAEIYICLELSCFFNDPSDVGSLISGSSVFSKTSLNIWKFMVHILLKPGLPWGASKEKFFSCQNPLVENQETLILLLLLSLFSPSVVSNSLQPHGLQHAMLPCPSPSLGVCSNSFLLIC